MSLISIGSPPVAVASKVYGRVPPVTVIGKVAGVAWQMDCTDSINTWGRKLPSAKSLSTEPNNDEERASNKNVENPQRFCTPSAVRSMPPSKKSPAWGIRHVVVPSDDG